MARVSVTDRPRILYRTIMNPVLGGSLTALCWGGADFIARYTGRAMGHRTALLGMLVVSAVVITALAFALRVPFSFNPAGFGYLLTPAADLSARIIKLQDEMSHPVGAVIEFMGDPLPQTFLVDPGAARREIFRSRWLLPYLKWQARRLEKRATWSAENAVKSFARPRSHPIAAE